MSRFPSYGKPLTIPERSREAQRRRKHQMSLKPRAFNYQTTLTRRRLRLWWLCLLSLFMVANVAAIAQPQQSSERVTKPFLFTWPGQDDAGRVVSLSAPMVTDRPSFTDASRPVGAGVTQIELGYTYSYDDSKQPRDSSHSYPELGVRQGVLRDWLELRLTQSFSNTDSSNNRSSNSNYYELGSRLGLLPQHGLLPEISITPHLLFPTGSSTLSSQQALSGLVSAYSWSVTRSLSIAGGTQNIQQQDSERDFTYALWGQSAIVTLQLDQTTSVWLEGFASLPARRATDRESYYVDTGVLFLLTNNLQLDARVGSRLQDGFATDIFAGMGLAVRYF